MTEATPGRKYKHYRTVEERLWRYVTRGAPDECWLWRGEVGHDGYGRVALPGRKRGMAHRFAYELLVGPITDETLDHLCGRPLCVNPGHTVPASRAANSLRGDGPPAQNARKTACKHGHPFAGENLRVLPNGRRVCVTCGRAASARWQARRASERAAAHAGPGC